MEYKKRLSFFNGLLSIMLVFSIFPFISLMYQLYIGGVEGITNNVFRMIVGLLIVIGYFMIVLTLKKIVHSIKRKNPFISENVISFTKIGFYILLVGILDAILRYPIPNNSGLEILATSYGDLKPIFFIYLVLSFLSYILSDVFRMAMEIKDENDLTV